MMIRDNGLLFWGYPVCLHVCVWN